MYSRALLFLFDLRTGRTEGHRRQIYFPPLIDCYYNIRDAANEQALIQYTNSNLQH